MLPVPALTQTVAANALRLGWHHPMPSDLTLVDVEQIAAHLGVATATLLIPGPDDLPSNFGGHGGGA